MNRQQRREQQLKERKSIKRFKEKQTWSRKEHELELNAAYEIGARFALQAATEVLKLGETRQRRITDRLTEIEMANGITRAEGSEGK